MFNALTYSEYKMCCTLCPRSSTGGGGGGPGVVLGGRVGCLRGGWGVIGWTDANMGQSTFPLNPETLRYRNMRTLFWHYFCLAVKKTSTGQRRCI